MFHSKPTMSKTTSPDSICSAQKVYLNSCLSLLDRERVPFLSKQTVFRDKILL